MNTTNTILIILKDDTQIICKINSKAVNSSPIHITECVKVEDGKLSELYECLKFNSFNEINEKDIKLLSFEIKDNYIKYYNEFCESMNKKH